MDDFIEFIFMWFIAFALIMLIIFGASKVGDAIDDSNNKKQDKRYELCLKKNMQWVDGNCISGK